MDDNGGIEQLLGELEKLALLVKGVHWLLSLEP